MSERELRTSEVARIIGVTPDLLRKWNYRGLLKLAPVSRAGAGRSNESHWTPEAVDEAKRLNASLSTHKPRTRV